MKQQSALNERQRVNKPSALLSHDENELVFSLMGRRCQTMCTAVVQLFTTESPAHSAWIRRLNGIACFVRDSAKRSYSIRVYCLLKNDLVWEEEMYDSILINKPREFLISFEGKDSMVALSFASTAETNSFYKTATTTVSNRTKRRHERRSRKFSPNHNQNDENDSTVMLRNMPIQSNNPIHQFNHIPQPTAMTNSNPIKDKKKSNRKLTKADISMPTNFKHIVHVGWSAQTGFDLKGEEASSLNAFLEKAGVSEQQLNDRDTRAFIYDFIQHNNVLDSVKLEEEQDPPPVPSRQHNGAQRSAPPPPPAPNVTRQPTIEHHQVSPRVQNQRGPPPSRPPPIDFSSQNTQQSSAPAPPPPPPPPPMMSAPLAPPPPPVASSASLAPPVPDVRSALMDSIRKGATLKKVDHAALSTGSSNDTRGDLLSEIRQGIELRPAADRGDRDSSTKSGGTDALADALRRALQERGKVLRSSDESDSDSTDNGEWED